MSDIQYITVDSELRTMTVPSGEEILGVYNDRNIERKYFQVPRYYEDTDLYDFTICINYKNALNTIDASYADDVTADDEYITFLWTVPHRAVAAPGITQFSLCFKLIESDEIVKEYNTTYYSGKVLPGVEPADATYDDDPAVVAEVTRLASEAASSAQDASESELNAEAWAVGTRNGVDVESTDDAYHNNAKYYAEQMAASAIETVRVDGVALTVTDNTVDIPAASAGTKGVVLIDADLDENSTDSTVPTSKAVYDLVDGDYTELKSAITQLTANLVNESATGNPLVITDGADGIAVKDCSIAIEPSQPNDYDSVWVGGAGKNLIPLRIPDATYYGFSFVKNTDGTLSITGSKTTSGNNDVYISSSTGVGTEDQRVSLPAGEYKVSGITGGSVSTYRLYLVIHESTTRYIGLNDGTVTFTLTDTTGIAMFIRLFEGLTLSSALVVSPMICLSTEDDAFAPYSNICPISGWTECNILRTGANLFDSSTATDNYMLNPSTGALEANTLTFVTDYIYVKENATYYLPNRGTSRFVLFDLNKTYVEKPSDTTTAMAWTSPQDGYIRVTCNKSITTIADFQISVGSSATDYEAYTGNTYTIDLSSAGTVYGGTLDVTTGVLTVTHKVSTLTFNTPTVTDSYGRWQLGTAITDVDSSLLGKQWALTTDASYGFRTDRLPIAEENSSVTGKSTISFYGHNSNVEARVRIATSFTAEEAKAIADATVICYPTASTTYTLTPREVTTLLKNNVLTCNCGDITLSYYADTKTYIDNAIATAINSL